MGNLNKLDELKNVSDRKKFVDEAYALWGTMQNVTRDQGWYPSMKDPQTNVVTFRSEYNPAFNTVLIPGEKDYGHVEVLGKPDKTFDLVIRKASGAIDRYLYQNASPETIQSWMVQSGGNVGSRVKHIPSTQQFVKQ